MGDQRAAKPAMRTVSGTKTVTRRSSSARESGARNRVNFMPEASTPGNSGFSALSQAAGLNNTEQPVFYGRAAGGKTAVQASPNNKNLLWNIWGWIKTVFQGGIIRRESGKNQPVPSSREWRSTIRTAPLTPCRPRDSSLKIERLPPWRAKLETPTTDLPHRIEHRVHTDILDFANLRHQLP